MRMKFWGGILMTLVVSLPALAATREHSDLGQIRAQQSQIREDAAAGKGIYANLSQRDRTQLFLKQDIVLGLVQDKQSADELNESQRLRLFNELESIEALVNRAEDERVTCERVATIGTNRKERVCKTVAQRREEMRMAQDRMNRGTNAPAFEP